jgi:hypothetical protein
VIGSETLVLPSLSSRSGLMVDGGDNVALTKFATLAKAGDSKRSGTTKE